MVRSKWQNELIVTTRQSAQSQMPPCKLKPLDTGASDHPHHGGLLLTIIRVIAVAVVVVAIGLVDQPYSRLSRKS